MARVIPFLIVAGLLGPGAGAGVLAADAADAADAVEAIDLDALLADAKAVQQRDLGRWTSFTFRREVLRRSLDGDLEEKSRELLEFVVRPGPDGEGFDEQVLRIDGELATEREQRRHRDAARFTKHYLQALGRDDEIHSEANPILHLWDSDNYSYAGEEVLHDVRCHRIEMEASPEPDSGGIKARLAAANTGTLWLAVDGLRIVQSETRVGRHVKLPMGLGKLKRFEVRMVTTRLDDGIRLPAEIEVGSEVTVLGKTIRKQNRYRYTAFKPR